MNIDKYTRTRFYEKNYVNGIKECDFKNSNFHKFKLTRPVRTYKVTYQDLQRPDRISYKIFNTISYWWIIMRVNDISDIWNDLYVGMILIIPDQNDIEEFVIKARK